MLAHLTRRLLSGLLLLFTLTALTYVVFFTIPTDPACRVVYCGPGSNTTSAQRKAMQFMPNSPSPPNGMTCSFPEGISRT